ncbi:cell division protein ZapA [Kordiimonas pumila]|uniref:Cell division protein ZapA n=1 Tax=Kordiimonas pumila TaxID=2161677 RepID=A0ABV7D6Y4_9PROT|nr:cell division protein ZapA [Kordiimonas pumila]
MAQITVSINGKTYPLACADGDEERLHKLASYVDSKAKSLSSKLGHINESRLMLMSAVLIADELHDALENKGSRGIIGSVSEDELAKIINEVASEVEGIAEKLPTP